MNIPKEISQIKLPQKGSHKGQNGRLLVIGGSHLFHAASLWSLKVASRIVDLVHYSSVPENNQIVQDLKKEFRDGIVVPREDIEAYIEEDDCILIGPGMMRAENTQVQSSKLKARLPARQVQSLKEVEQIKDEGVQTAALTNYLLKKHSRKQWVIDAGALQMMDLELIPKGAILTPHHREFADLFSKTGDTRLQKLIDQALKIQVSEFAKRYECIVLVKGEVDIACSGVESAGRLCVPGTSQEITGGNSGMTKGGTGDVLAGLIAALATHNDPWVATVAGSYINKRAGDELFKRVGVYFNASDLADEIPRVMKELLFS